MANIILKLYRAKMIPGTDDYMDIGDSTHRFKDIYIIGDIVLTTTDGTKIGTATNQKLGFFNTIPIVQPSNTSDIKDALIALGFVASGGATPLDLDGGIFNTSGEIRSDGTRINYNLATYATGSGYSLTTTPSLLNFGTTDPSVTIDAAGTYLLFSRARIDYNAATFSSSQIVTLKLRRTNNTAADLADALTSAKTEVITTLSYTMGTYSLPPVIYTTANTDDVIQLFGSVDGNPDAGSIDAVEADIEAIRLY